MRSFGGPWGVRDLEVLCPKARWTVGLDRGLRTASVSKTVTMWRLRRKGAGQGLDLGKPTLAPDCRLGGWLGARPLSLLLSSHPGGQCQGPPTRPCSAEVT